MLTSFDESDLTLTHPDGLMILIMADEEDYLDLVIAGELVSQWLTVIDTSGRVERVMEAVEKLKEGAERSEAYIEEVM